MRNLILFLLVALASCKSKYPVTIFRQETDGTLTPIHVYKDGRTVDAKDDTIRVVGTPSPR